MDILSTLDTGHGIWNPVVWLLAAGIAAVIAYLIWAYGESGYKRGTEQTKPFLSGNAEPEKGDVHVRGSHLYWGFTEALKGYFDRIVPLHTGVLNDYTLWFLGTTALILVMVGLI
ncbi:MAG: hydrogenase [Methanomicrobiaceae archaeon]|uniref:Membrane bound hydrogenase, mbhi subunit n=1 Tax=hydrocarbon metagenome TaxID=938273 RepID=A0A0W8FH76_9ZZZZ|nr:hydrogenase [Methanomicrobiaceae archaeon]MDD5419861.1 hydrogenase [Methanomicrobiaceae archaeon]